MTRLEKLALAEEVSSLLRHDLRNKMGSIRNATFYLRRRFKDCEAWQADPRVATFFELIDKELGAVEDLLTGREGLPGLPDRSPERMRVGPIVAEVIRPFPGIRAKLADESTTMADPADVRLLASSLLDYALERAPQSIMVGTADVADGVALDVEVPGAGRVPTVDQLVAEAKGLGALALRSARRLAGRNFATVSTLPAEHLVIRIVFGGVR